MTVNYKTVINSGKITASKETLNYLSILAGEAVERYKSIGCHSLARDAEEFHNAIYEALEGSGYYDCLASSSTR